MSEIGAEDTRMSADIYQNQVFTNPATVDTSKQMWEYRNRGIYGGIPVKQDAKNLAVHTAQELTQALQLDVKACVWTGYISPQPEDAQNVKAFAQIKQREAAGQLIILEQNKQFCPGINKFLLLVIYNQTYFALNPRFQYLKQEQI